MRQSGTAEATDKYQLSRDLKGQGIIVLTVTAESSKSWNILTKLNEKFSTVSFKEQIFFVSNLAEMLRAGLSLTRALKVALKQGKNPKVRKVITSLIEDVDKGDTFAHALDRFPDIFPRTTVAMVEAGEKSGRLPDGLTLVSNQMLKTYQLRKKIKGALMYPAIVLLAMIGIGVMMLVYIVPTLAATFAELGAELPFSTRMIIGFSNFLTAHYVVALILLIMFVVGIYFARRLLVVKRGVAWLLLRLPAIGPIVKQSNSAITARTLSSLLFSGVDIVASLSITERVLSNPFYKELIHGAAEAVPKGSTLSIVFGAEEAQKLYPPFVAEMMSVGEETGKLPDMLLKLAEFYENEVDTVVKDLSTIIEPLIMLMVGIGVGFFALSMIQPIYSVGDNI